MKTYIIDTNALISFITDRDTDQQEIIATIFKSAANLKKTVLCPQNVLTEFIYVMEKVYGIPKMTIHTMIRDFISMPGIKIIHDIDLNILFSYWPEHIPDFGDAVVAGVCKANKGSVVATFDKKFVGLLRRLDLIAIFY
ncbi:MAG: type II toxin-antitoxin system VapC family toxin [Deltaproteobacteria bacterium]|nr:MAG: type II toxin-antitoxin system VapC family toxin [Deltaproteobacteria bacterium]